MATPQILTIASDLADQLETALYEIETASRAIDAVLAAKLEPDLIEATVGALNIRVLANFADCCKLLVEAQILASCRPASTSKGGA